MGAVQVAGAKNSVLKLMAAALLAEGTTTLRQVPGILDVTFMAQLLDTLGCSAKVDADEQIATIAVPHEIGHQCDYELVRKLRASISVLGPLLARCGRAEVALPGGDNIGSRGLNMHVAGLEAMGAKVHIEHGFVIAEAPQGLHGAEVWLDFPSVGATETIMMAAVLAARYDDHRERGPGAGDPGHRRDAGRDGRPDRRRRVAADRGHRSDRSAQRRSSTPWSRTGSCPGAGRSRPRSPRAT